MEPDVRVFDAVETDEPDFVAAIQRDLEGEGAAEDVGIEVAPEVDDLSLSFHSPRSDQSLDHTVAATQRHDEVQRPHVACSICVGSACGSQHARACDGSCPNCRHVHSQDHDHVLCISGGRSAPTQPPSGPHRQCARRDVVGSGRPRGSG